MTHRILFVCHGNICRSPMAEYVMKDLVEKRGLSDEFEIESCATSTEEIGSDVYPPARAELEKHGVRCGHRRARQITQQDVSHFDHIVAMDSFNLRNISRLTPYDHEGRIRLLMDFAGEHRDVEDPWYTGDFSKAYEDILKGCQALLDSLVRVTRQGTVP